MKIIYKNLLHLYYKMTLKRIFLGIPLSSEIKKKTKGIQKDSEGISGSFKLVEPDKVHLTLKFLGEIEEEELNRVKEILGKLNLGEKFKVKVKRMGVFPNESYVKVIWLGLENSEKVLALQKKIDNSLSKMFPVEPVFLAHITLVRVKFVKDKEKLKEFLSKYKEVELGEWGIDKVVLYESILKEEGSEYKVVEEYDLGKEKK